MKKLAPFILLLLMSCEVKLPFDPPPDPPPIVVSGRVIDGVDEEPMSGVTMTVVTRESTGLFGWGGSERQVAETSSTDNGSFKFTLRSGRTYTVKASSPQMIEYTADYTGHAFATDSERVGLNGRSGMELRLRPTAFFVVTPQTKNPLGPNDELTVTIGVLSFSTRYQSPPFSWLVAGENIEVGWRVRRGGVTRSHAIDVPIERHAVMEYTLNY